MIEVINGVIDEHHSATNLPRPASYPPSGHDSYLTADEEMGIVSFLLWLFVVDQPDAIGGFDVAQLAVDDAKLLLAMQVVHFKARMETLVAVAALPVFNQG